MGNLIPFPATEPQLPFLDVLTAQLYQLHPFQVYHHTELQQRGIPEELLTRSFPLHSFSSPPHYYGASTVCQALQQYTHLDQQLDQPLPLQEIILISTLGGVILHEKIVEKRLRCLEEGGILVVEGNQIPTHYFNTVLWDVLAAHCGQPVEYGKKVVHLDVNAEVANRVAESIRSDDDEDATTFAVEEVAPPPSKARSEIRDEPTLQYTAFIRRVACGPARRLPPHIQVQDLESAGWEGFLDAREKYDGVRNFMKYAEYRIKGSMLDYLRSIDPLGRDTRTKAIKMGQATQKLLAEKGEATEEDLAAELGLPIERIRTLRVQVNEANMHSLEDLTESRPSWEVRQGGKFDAENEMVEKLSGERVRKALTQVSNSRRRECLNLYFFHDLRLREIGEKFCVTESRASQLMTEGLQDLRAILGEEE